MELVRYIHNNPYRARLEKEIGRHKWTSHSSYMNRESRPSWLKTEDLLMQFSEYEKEAMRGLDVFVKKEVPKELSEALNSIRWPAILGGEAFKARIREMLRGKKIEKREVPQYKESMRTISACEAIKIIEEKSGAKDILTQKKSRRYSLKRRAFWENAAITSPARWLP